VKNTGKQSTKEIYIYPPLHVLAWNYTKKDGISEENIMTGEVDYLKPQKAEKDFTRLAASSQVKRWIIKCMK
jgi:hypothetical protein